MDIAWVMYANMAVWIVIGGYIAFLARKVALLNTRLRRMEYAASRGASSGKDAVAGSDTH